MANEIIVSAQVKIGLGLWDLGLTIFFKLTDYKYRLKPKPNFCCEGAALPVLMSVCACMSVVNWSLRLYTTS